MHNYDTYNNNHQSDAGALVIRKALVSRAASTRSLEVPQRYAYLSGPAEPTYVADYVVTAIEMPPTCILVPNSRQTSRSSGGCLTGWMTLTAFSRCPAISGVDQPPNLYPP